MARVEPRHAGIRALARSLQVAAALHRIAEDIQAEAVRTSPVDTGRYAASWRVVEIRQGQTVAVRVLNKVPYARYVEYGYRHHRSGKHIAGQRILGRAILTARR